jgi:hypothetical protein
MRTMCTVAVAALGLGTWVGTAYGQTVPPTVDVSYSTTAGSVVALGSTFDISVLAEVQNPGSVDNGIFVFSQDFVEENLSTLTPTPFDILSLTMPATETSGAALPSSGGTPVNDGSGNVTGVDGIYGGYSDDTLGVGSPTEVFTVQIKAVAPGVATFIDGPSAAEYFTNETADGFELYDGSNPTATYPAGPTITVASVPEPTLVGLLGLIMSTVSFRWRGRGSSRDGCLDTDGNVKAPDEL